MKVYFLKTDINQYVIFPAPEDESLYFVLDVESDDELAQKTPVLHKGTNNPPPPTNGTERIGESHPKNKPHFWQKNVTI